MNLSQLDIYPVKICQTDRLYQYQVKIGLDKPWQEDFIGCPNKCLFCHYTWARNRIDSGTYHQGSLTDSKSPEYLWRDIFKVTKKQGRIRTAIDGFSERLRMTYGKKISNQDIIDGINHLGSFGGTTVILAYNISNMPNETDDDRQELYDTVKKANPQNRVILVVHSTPFRPSLVTPLQYAPVKLYPAISDLSAQVIHDSDNLRVMHSFTNESPFSQLETVIVSRATQDTDKLFHAICFHPKLKNGTAKRKVDILKMSFDLSPYLKEYHADEKHPSWFLSSHTENKKLCKIYDIAQIKISK